MNVLCLDPLHVVECDVAHHEDGYTVVYSQVVGVAFTFTRGLPGVSWPTEVEARDAWEATP